MHKSGDYVPTIARDMQASKQLLYSVFAIAFASISPASAENLSLPDVNPDEASSSSLAPGDPLLRTTPEPALPAQTDPCATPEIQPNSMSPTWNRQAGTVQCGALETDNLTILQPMGEGVSQWIVGTTTKYGVTPRLELRWGLPGRMYQGGNGSSPMAGTTDQWLGVLFRFRDQQRWIPDLALDYAFKIPSGNPAKGFGSGYGDHLLTFIASRDLGPNHIDFNAVETIAGGPAGHDGAAQFGVGFSRTLAHHIMATIEAFGGPQPATHDRYGALFAGGSWGFRPRLAFNGGTIRSYTGGSPRAQYMFGFIYTVRPGLTPPRGSRLSHLLGR